MFIVDAHLDLSHNAVDHGREVLRPAAEQTPDAGGIPTVGLPDLKAGGVGLICATVFCMPSMDGKPGCRTPDEAHAVAMKQLQWYQTQEAAGRFRLIRNASELPSPGAPIADAQPAILLLEGADPLRTPADVADWHAAGLRIVGLAWRRTRYAGGTGEPGGLSPDGMMLVARLDRFGIIHDVSHLAELAFWQLTDATDGPLIASHSNCRAIVPTDRQLSDAMIKKLIARGGVIGINFFDKFLLPPSEYGTRRATLADVVRHAQHICDLAGNADHVAIGTDMDGGLGRNEIPMEIQTSADLPKVVEALDRAGFSDRDAIGIMGCNWLRFMRRNLPHRPEGNSQPSPPSSPRGM